MSQTIATRGTVDNLFTILKRLFVAGQTAGFMRMLADSQSYLGAPTAHTPNPGRNVFYLSDLDIKISYEHLVEIPADDTVVLDKPRVVFDGAYNTNIFGMSSLNGTEIGLQLGLYVNAEPLGRMYLDAYTTVIHEFLISQCNGKAADYGIHVMRVNKSPAEVGSLSDWVRNEWNDRILCCFIECDLVYFASEVKNL